LKAQRYVSKVEKLRSVLNGNPDFKRKYDMQRRRAEAEKKKQRAAVASSSSHDIEEQQQAALEALAASEQAMQELLAEVEITEKQAGSTAKGNRKQAKCKDTKSKAGKGNG
jgi:hypothetical protein